MGKCNNFYRSAKRQNNAKENKRVHDIMKMVLYLIVHEMTMEFVQLPEGRTNGSLCNDLKKNKTKQNKNTSLYTII